MTLPGTTALRITLPNHREERIPRALIMTAIQALPDSEAATNIRAVLTAWTRGTIITLQIIKDAEQELLELAHGERGESGLLNKISFGSVGQIVDPASLPEDWSQLQVLAVLSLALRRFRILGACLGSVLDTVDQDLVPVDR